MAVTISNYNHVPFLFAAQKVDLTNLRCKLLNGSASFTATQTSEEQVDNGSKATVTITIATPGVVTWTAHGFSAGQAVQFLTTGALPTGLTAGTWYYVIAAGLTTNTFQVSATAGGSAINTTGTQSGVHTGYSAGSFEFSGFAWPVGGPQLASVAITQVVLDGDAVSNDAKLSATDVDVVASGGSITGNNALVYDATHNYPLAFVAFGQTQSAGDTTDFKIRWGANGIVNWKQP